MKIIDLLIVSLYLIAGNLYWTAQNADYNPIRQTICELAEKRSRYSLVIRYSFFLPIGLFFLWIAFREQFYSIKDWICGLIGISYTVSTFFPCDASSSFFSGSWQQWIHHLSNTIKYIGSGIIIYLTEQLLFAQIVFFLTLILLFPPLFAIRGLIQRVLEGFLLGWLLFV